MLMRELEVLTQHLHEAFADASSIRFVFLFFFPAWYKGRLSGEARSNSEGKRHICFYSVQQTIKLFIIKVCLFLELETKMVHALQTRTQILQRQNGEFSHSDM